VGKSRLVEELERALAEEEGKKTARPAKEPQERPRYNQD
jgi:hypothetical protein